MSLGLGNGGGGGGGGGDLLIPGGPPAKGHGGPFIDWSSPGSIISSPVRGIAGIGHAVYDLNVAAGKGLIGLGAAAGKEAWHDVKPLPLLFHKPGEFFRENQLNGSEAQHPESPVPMLSSIFTPTAEEQQQRPLSSMFGPSVKRTATDVEQLGRLAINTPTQPFGFTPGGNIGRLGEGPGLLGRSDLAAATKRGGGGIVPKLAEDAANFSLVAKPVSEIFAAGADSAAAEAAAHGERLSAAEAAAKAARSDAETAVKEAAKRAEAANKSFADVGQRAAGGYDPQTAVQYQQAQTEASAAAESLRQAQEFARSQAAEHGGNVSELQRITDEAKARADKLQGHADTAKRVLNLGSKAAASPFAPLFGYTTEGGTHIPGVFGAAGKAVGAVAGRSEHLADAAARLQQMGETIQEHAQQRGIIRGQREQGQIDTLNMQQAIERGFANTERELPTAVDSARRGPLGLFRHKAVDIADVDAQAVAMMDLTGEGAQFGQMLQTLGPDTAIEVASRAARTKYTPEQWQLAAKVFGPGAGDEYVQSIRDALPNVRREYSAEGGALEQQNASYAQLQGEANASNVRPHAGEGAFAQVEHNLEGRGPRIDAMPETTKALIDYERNYKRGTQAVEQAGKRLIRAAAKRDGLNISPAELRNPEALLSRVYEPATATARAILADPAARATLADAPERTLAAVAKGLDTGRYTPETAVAPLTDAIVRLATKNPETLSPAAADVLARTNMGEVPKGIPAVGSATGPALTAGAGIERARIGGKLTEQGVKDIVRGQKLYGRAMEKLAGPTRAPSARVASMVNRLVSSARRLELIHQRLTEAVGRTAEHEGTDLFGQAGISKKQVADTVRDVRRQVKSVFKAEADDLLDEMSARDVMALRWPPPTETRPVVVRKAGAVNKGANVMRKVYKADPFIDVQAMAEEDKALLADQRFFVKDVYNKRGELVERGGGKTPEELTNEWRSSKTRGQRMEGPASYEGAASDDPVREWLDTVKTIRELEAAAKVSSEKGWDPEQFGRARSEVMGALNDAMGPELARELADRVAYGHPPTIASEIAGRIAEHQGAERAIDVRAEPGGDVANALEADRQREEGGLTGTPGRQKLDQPGRALYDEQVRMGQAATQGHVVANTSQRLTRAVEGGQEAARAQGQAEGALTGRSEQLQSSGERLVGQGEALTASGTRTAAQAPELQQEAAQRVAGPIGRMYGKAGEAEAGVTRAAAQYAKEKAALERLDTKLAVRLKDLEARVEAQPRPARPALEFGERVHKILGPMADAADKEFGQGAGDVLRAAGADVTSGALNAYRTGALDPMYVQGTRDLAASDMGNAPNRSGGPVVGKTGYRELGTGGHHPTTITDLNYAAQHRIEQIADNETGHKIRAQFGDSLRGALAKAGIDADQLSPAGLAQALKDHDLAAWDLSDRNGRMVRGAELTGDTPVVPRYVWKTWQRWSTPVQRDGIIGGALKGYDKTTRFLKHLIRLSPRWQVAITTGHSIMAMVGAGIDPVSYAHDVGIAIRLERMARAGKLTAEDQAWIAEQRPELQAALERHGGFLPGSIRNRGFVHETELLPTQATREPFGITGQRLQSTLDNYHRTAVWVGQLEKGLDARGLADFRAQFPDLAHLSDQAIRDEAAIRISIRTMGDYLNLTHAERSVMGRIVFFYPWLRHITKLTLNTAIHNPLRMVWLLHLGAMFDGQGPNPLDFLDRSFDIGKNRHITPMSWNPFAHLGPVSGEPMSGLNPILTTGAAALTGFNLNTGKPVTRPPGEKGALSPGQALGFALNQVPMARAAKESVPALFGGTPLVRYQTGQPIFSGGRPIPSNEDQFLGTNTMVPSWLAPLMPLSGVPRQQVVNSAEVLASRQKASARDAASRARYAALLARQGG